jgi:hypothetical protein
MADKKRNILEFVKQSNFEQFTPTLETQPIKKRAEEGAKGMRDRFLSILS